MLKPKSKLTSVCVIESSVSDATESVPINPGDRKNPCISFRLYLNAGPTTIEKSAALSNSLL